MQVLLVLVRLQVALYPLFPSDGGIGADESREHLCVLVLDFFESEGAVEAGVGLEVASHLAHLRLRAQACLGSTVVNLHDATYHALVAFGDVLLAEDVSGEGVVVPEALFVLRVHLALGLHDV